MHCRFAILFLIFCFSFVANGQSLIEEIDHYQVFSWHTSSFIRDYNQSKQSETSMNLMGYDLNLKRNNIISPTYKSVNNEGKVSQMLPFDIQTFSGVTKSGGRVALTVGEGFIYGIIKDLGSIYFIEPLTFYDSEADMDDFIFYNSMAVNSTTTKTCGATWVKEEEELLQPYFEAFSSGLCYTVEYGICHDYSMIDKYGSQALAEAFAIGVTNAMITNYDDEFEDEIAFQISGQYSITCMGCEPWVVDTVPRDMIDNFSDWASVYLDANPINIQHDVASLWTDIDLEGDVVGIAYLGGTCLNTRYNVLQDFAGTADQKRVLLAHELGHNFNATHDASGSNFIMAPSITVTDNWSSKSITRMEAFYKDTPCLDVCPGITPRVNVMRDEIPVMEIGVLNNGWCGGAFTPVNMEIELSHILDDSVVVAIDINPASTAHADYDYRLLNDTVTFYQGGVLRKNVTIEVLDDYVDESTDTLVLDLSIVEGNAIAGTNAACMIVIYDATEGFTSQCCTSLPPVTIGDASYLFNGIFFGTHDAKSRTLLRSEDLQAAGLTIGYIDQLSLYVATKNSNGVYENFRIGMRQVNLTEMNFTWYSTTEVFHGDISTVEGQWNDFTFYQPFHWDGVSDLYIDFCFDNRDAIGRDFIIGWDPTNQGYDLFSYRAANYSIGCDLNSGSFFYNEDRNPQVRLRKSGSPVWESQITSPVHSSVKAGETSHFYSQNGKIVASVKNLGSENIDCIEVSVVSSGNGKQLMQGTSRYISDKNFMIDVENDNAYYELTLYYTYQEMNSWSGDLDDLTLVQSATPLPLDPNDDRITGIYSITQHSGSFSDYLITTTIHGSGYLAISDLPIEASDVVILQGDYVLNSTEGKIMMNSLGGNCYSTSPQSGSWITAACDGSPSGSTINSRSMVINDPGGALYFKSGMDDYTAIQVDNQGDLILAENVAAPNHAIYLPDDHLALQSPGGGVVLRSVGNKCYKITVEESGAMVVYQVKCIN